MTSLELAPAALLAISVTAALACAQLVPSGDAMLLVRVPPQPEAALMAAARAGAALVSTPAPGFAILNGSAPRIRAALGLAVVWQERPPCSSSP